MPQYRLLISIGLLSAALIAFQLALMQILSFVQWHHFAYMIISVALLGFGAAGSVLAILRQQLIAQAETLLPFLMLLTGITLALVTDVSQFPVFRFDSYLLFSDYRHAGKLLLTCLLFFLPFFWGALAIGLVFVQQVNNIGRLYFANLLGSGAGGLLALVLIHLFFPRQLPACIAVLPVLAALLALTRKHFIFQAGVAAAAILTIGWKMVHPPHLAPSQYKDLSKTLLLPGAQTAFETSSAYGVVQAVTSPVLRYGPGLSLTAQKTAQTKMALFVNGDWFGAVTDWQRSDSSTILDYTTFALPYIMASRKNVLVLKAGTGTDVAHAICRKAERITAVEPNAAVLAALKGRLAAATDSLLYHPAVSVRQLDPRTFLLADTRLYDLIVLPVVGTFGGSAGLYALQEQFFLTREAFREMWLQLNKGGAIAVTCWMDYPVRNPLKIAATLAEVLAGLGIKNLHHHIAAVRSWGTITFVVTRTPLQPVEISRIRAFCNEMMFDPALLPQLTADERTAYNQLQDNRFFNYLDKILSDERKQFYADYDFHIRPATDDKPYFSQFIRWKNLNRIAQFFGSRSLPFFEIGYLLVLVTLLQISLASLVLILLPLFKTGWRGQHKLQVILYFAGIGLGYMFVEMVLIQRFILYFGNPVYAAAAVITLLLICSGIGSRVSHLFQADRKRMVLTFMLILLLLIVYSFTLTHVLQQTAHWLPAWKIAVVLLLLAPLAFFMGIPFPAGLFYTAKIGAAVVPWAWGINGCVSVISTALATIVGVEMGFTWVLLIAALAYAVPLLVLAKWLYA